MKERKKKKTNKLVGNEVLFLPASAVKEVEMVEH